MDWTQGYVADTSYTTQYFTELAPPQLDLMALSGGVLPPDRADGHFRYCELGCGNGLSTLLLAAVNPQAHFVGIDFMPVHIATARALARQGGVTNVEFLELSFAEAVARDFEPFDYVVAHGVYSWIRPEIRSEMVAFMRRFLAPGGLAYLSYNCLPGWLSVSPVQKVVSEYASTLRGASTERVRQAFEFARQLLDKGATALASQPAAKRQIEGASKLPTNYLAQEFLNEHWHPLYVTDVMRELAPAKLEYVASAAAVENDLRIMANDETADLIRAQPTVELRELVKDLAVNARFRRDIYARGAQRLTGADQRQQMASRFIALVCAPEHVSYAAEYGGRQLTFDTANARRAVEILSRGPCSLQTLADAIAKAGTPDPLKVAIEIALVLIVAKAAMPVTPTDADVRRLNATLCARALEDGAGNALATTWGTGLLVEPLELAIMGAAGEARSQEEIASAMLRRAQRRGRGFSRQGQALQADAEALAFLQEQVARFRARRQTIFAQLGVQSFPALS